MPPIVSACRAAFFFLTRIPVGGFPYTPDAWRWASGWFPFVGLVIGTAMAAVWVVVENVGPLPAAALVTGLGMLLTGAFHEDGMADTADAIGGVVDRDKVFEILKDSRIGAFGAACLFITLLLRISLLARLGELTPAAVPALIIVSQCLARTPPVWLMATIPYVTQDDVAKSKLVTRAGYGQAWLATAWCATGIGLGLLAGAITVGESTAGVLAAAVITVLLGWRFVRRIGGLTGDFLGAAEQCAEVAFLLAVALVRGSGGA
jgi:adenosylcobinamide-GDP ribazoletransferase